MPVEIKNSTLDSQFKQLFPEIKAVYGQNYDLTIKGDLTSNGIPLIIDSSKGIIPQNLEVSIQLLCMNETMTANELAVEFTFVVDTVLNATLRNFVAYLNIPSLSVSGTKVSQDKIGVFARDYDKLFTSAFTVVTDEINISMEAGYPLSKLNDNIGFISSMITNTTITPFQMDGFMYAGFTYFTDVMGGEVMFIKNSEMTESRDSLFEFAMVE